MLREIHRLQRRVLLVGASLCAALSGCGTDEQSVGGPNKPEQRVEVLSAGQITSVVSSINQAEATQAQAALTRLQDDAVRIFAEQLLTEHRAQEAELATLQDKLGLKQESSVLKEELDQFAQKQNQNLEQESVDGLAPMFLDVQMMMHRRGLATVEQLLSQAQQPELRAYLENYRGVLKQHLEKAQQLRRRFPEMESSR